MRKLSLYLLIVFFTLPLSYAQLPPASFYHLKRDEDVLSSSYVCLEQDEFGFIWFGSFHGGGLYRYDGYELKSFVIDPADLNNSLVSNRINSVYAPGDNNLYISTHGGWNKLDLTTGDFQAFAYDHQTNPEEGSFYTNKIIKDSSQRLWIASYYGLSMMESWQNEISWLKPKDKSAQGQHPERIIDFILDRSNSNVLWLGSYHGLFSYDINSNKYTHFSTSPKDIHVMSQDQEGLIWIAIRNSTILHSFNPADQSWNQFPLDKNLPDMEYIHEIDILPDDQKWISTNHHVGIFNPQTNEYTAWQLDSTNVDGLLPQGDYYDILNDRHGRLWIGSWYGVQYAKGAFVIPNPIKNPAEVIIVELQSNNERADREKPLICTDHYDLLKDQRDFEIKYVLPNPLDPADVEYRYKLEGYDKDWIATRSRTARYSRITGGNYLFLVQGREGEDSYTETTSLSVSVEKKLSEFWWFWALCISGVTAMTTGGLWFRITGVRRAEKLKAKFEQDMAEIKMQALRAQMNPHFLFNCLNSIKYYAISKDKDATADYLSKFSLLVRTILNNSKSDKVALNDELEAIRLYIEIENLRLENKFNYEIEIDPSIKTTNIQIPPMVLQPYVENAIWHGLMHKNGKGQLKVQVKDLGNAIQCIVEDNGIGRQKSAQIAAQQPQIKKSMGMQITSDRLKLIREIHHVEIDVKVVDLTDSQGLTAGTKVIVEFPHPANDL